jgi:predicted dehydrogenase
MTQFAFSKKEPLLAEHEAFRNAILRGEKDYVSFRDRIEVFRVAEAILESGRVGQVVHLGPAA